MRFPSDFRWGTATAAYQVEGAVAEDGRAPSIWDTFSHTPGKVVGDDNGDIACDHYHRSADDVAMMAKLGLNAYRFSTSWSRVMPHGQVNQAGLDFYRRLVDDQLARGIEPSLTLYHWDLPQDLEDAGGWPNRDTAYRFADYVKVVHDALGDRVRMWTTFNEPWCTAFLGYGEGVHAPGRSNVADALAAAHHLNLGHGLALQHLNPQQTGISLNLHALMGEPEAVRRVDAVANRIFLDPIFHGSYPDDLLADTTTVTDWSFVRDGDLAIINKPTGMVGLNYYTRVQVAESTPGGSGEHSPHSASGGWPGAQGIAVVRRDLPVTEMDWEIDPAGLLVLLRRMKDECGGIPIYITENGAGYDGIDDQERINYLDAHLRVCSEAIAEGIPLRGYYLWSLMDNFEWAWGYSKRFGIIHVDYGSQARTLKASAHWYADLIRRS